VAQRAAARTVSNALELGLNCRQAPIDNLNPPFTIVLATLWLRDARVSTGIQTVVQAEDFGMS
jgi:hypothetical protein